MDIQGIVAQLREEASRIENAIAALLGLGSQPARGARGSPAGSKNATAASKPKRRTMSPAARKRISAAMKLRWAQRLGKSAPKKVAPPTKKATARKPMSAAAKKRLSELMKAKWTEKKKAGA